MNSITKKKPNNQATNIIDMSIKRSKPYIYLYHNFYKKAKFPSFEHAIDLYAKNKDSVFFIQIGANEGSTEDPLYRHIRLKNWKGILVEPQKDVFDQLVSNHQSNSNLIFENVAISSQEEVKKFYFIEPSPDVPVWVSKLSSFDKKITSEVVEKFPQAKVVSADMHCTTVKSMVKKHNIKKVDLILIDTEGFDYEILKTIDLKTLKPEMVVLEHRHLSAEDQNAAIKQMKDAGMYVFKDEHDTVGFTNPAVKEAYSNHLV